MISPEHSPPQPCPCVGLRFKSVPPAWSGKPETEELTEWKAPWVPGQSQRKPSAEVNRGPSEFQQIYGA